MANFESMSLAELKEAAKEKGLKNTSSMRKQELIDILTSVERKMEELKAKKEEVAAPSVEKTTLGDIESLAALKESLEAAEKKSKK